MLAIAIALMQVPIGPLYGYETPVITAAKGVITVQVKHDGSAVPTHPVPFTTEPFNLNVSGARVADEASLFGSGWAIDLDGDGQTTSKIKLWCLGKTGVFGLGVRAEPLGELVWEYAPTKIVRVGPKGAHALLYTPCARQTTLGISPANEPIEIHRLSGPVLQVQVIEMVADPNAKGTVRLGAVTVDGKPAKSVPIHAAIYEPLRGPKSEWARLAGVFIALPKSTGAQQVRVRFTGDVDAMVTSAVNVAPEPNQRKRGAFGFGRLTLPEPASP